ncbi:permease prefix domain 1-containing protein [Actinosynnema sp. NPDC047251]|uniref:Putative membrane protein n=1 Tax=Saccharothrix espanaensis (strain ATCC 51144 / DSM 44229 / JCM 9112 / NBRC 15066 / NRRL 15764) TaxID=1179773 RepID=K0JTP9_SACES|nr:permease prefix domain 1-containing protein [Saccharothrix espanaensis]CCH28194.1 putative membrane protein [Saccharothrix espanaensis DSM 44229]
MAGAGVIDEYLAGLDRRLRGPAPVKRDLLAEAQDSLVDAAEAHAAGGLDVEQAQRRAVAEFGPVHRVARDYQGLLALAHGVRTLWTVALVLPLAHVLWELNRTFWIGAWPGFGPSGPPPDWYLVIARANDSTGWVVAGAALGALPVGRLLARRGTGTVTLARLAGAVAAAAVGVNVLATVAITVATAHLDVGRLPMSPPVVAATAVSLLIMGRLAVLARRCLVFAPV